MYIFLIVEVSFTCLRTDWLLSCLFLDVQSNVMFLFVFQVVFHLFLAFVISLCERGVLHWD